MPIYTYRCENCGVQFEKTQKFTDAPLTRCPECNKKSLRKVYTPVGIVFKGSGFYATDHRSPSGASAAKSAAAQEKAEKAEKPAETKSEPKSETKSDTKSETSKPAAADSSSSSAGKAEKGDQ
jgi:putative FmdB family regulatory protein